MINVIKIFYGLIVLSYLLILGITITGLLKLALKENTTLRLIHKYATPPAIFFWILVMYGAILAAAGRPVMLAMLLTLEISLVFGGALTGWLAHSNLRRMLHMILGGCTFAFYTYFIFAFLLAGGN